MAKQAKIPEYLGKCEILHVHDDGDLTIKCRGKKFVVTMEGEVFKEYSAVECALEELEEPSEEWVKMSKEERREAFRRAMTRCVAPKLKEEIL